MKQGSKAHQKLEDEVHATFSVEVMTKEDAWGLRFWNIIQGARTLRETGMTREMEVWGLIDGELVNGIIDELTYECPNYDMEMDTASAAAAKGEKTTGGLEAGQQTIQDFYKSQNASASTQNASANRFADAPESAGPKVYLKDHKTRTSRSIPKASAFKPTAMQLMIYHRLLSNLVSPHSSLDPAILWDRYSVNPDTPFSDSFITQFGEPAPPSPTTQHSLPSTIATTSTPLHPIASATNPSQSRSSHSPSIHTQTTDPSPLSISFDDLNLILRSHPTPRSLWSRMLAELRRALPAGLGNVLRVEYWDQTESDQLGVKNFAYDAKLLDEYSGRTMGWWKGEREPVGVDVEDAWKCRICEFSEGCGWRLGKVEESVRRARAKAPKGKKGGG